MLLIFVFVPKLLFVPTLQLARLTNHTKRTWWEIIKKPINHLWDLYVFKAKLLIIS